MLTRGEDVEAHALRERGWSISAIARHLGRDRKTVRSYLNGERVAGVRARPDVPDPLANYEKYIRSRFSDDHHVWGTVLFDEVCGLGYSQSYPTFARQIRMKGLRLANDRLRAGKCLSERPKAPIGIDVVNNECALRS